MYVLVATKETQGDRGNDYLWTVDGGLVFVPTIECDEPRCGCSRGFAGVSSHRATTTAMVVDRPELDHDGYRDALFDAMTDQGYGIAGDDELADAIGELITVVQLLGTAFGDGAVMGRCGPRLSLRRPGCCQTP